MGVCWSVRRTFQYYSLAVKLFTNTTQVCAGLIARAFLSMGLLMLLMGDVRELFIDGLDHCIDPSGSTLLVRFSWDKGITLLSCVPQKVLDTVLSKAWILSVYNY